MQLPNDGWGRYVTAIPGIDAQHITTFMVRNPDGSVQFCLGFMPKSYSLRHIYDQIEAHRNGEWGDPDTGPCLDGFAPSDRKDVDLAAAQVAFDAAGL